MDKNTNNNKRKRSELKEVFWASLVIMIIEAVAVFAITAFALGLPLLLEALDGTLNPFYNALPTVEIITPFAVILINFLLMELRISKKTMEIFNIIVCIAYPALCIGSVLFYWRGLFI